MQSTLKYKSKTHSGVLPQLRTLEVPVDVSGKVKPGTIGTGPLRADQAGFQHGRGESPAPAGPSPSPRGEEKRGVTRIFVLSKDGRPLMPCHAARARELLRKGRAVVVRRSPFVIRLKHNPDRPGIQPVAIKLDPGAKTTGIALVRLTSSAQIVLHLAELTHRGASIRESLAQRRAFRRNRRTRLDKYGFPRGYLCREKRVRGFQTGDIVRASIAKGRKAGVHLGRVAIRASGSFNIQTGTATIQGVSYKHCLRIQRADGYNYTKDKDSRSSHG